MPSRLALALLGLFALPSLAAITSPSPAPHVEAGPAARPAVDDRLPRPPAAVEPAGVERGALAAPVAAAEDRYGMPLAGARITQRMGPNTGGIGMIEGVPTHLGVDLATRCGDRIVAAHDGTVLAAGRREPLAHLGFLEASPEFVGRLRAADPASMAISVVIDDGNGFTSIYSHFSKIVVKAGQEVRAGDVLGLEGDSGRASGCHLHYAMFRTDGGEPIETNMRPWASSIRSIVPRRMHEFVDPLPYLTGERTATAGDGSG